MNTSDDGLPVEELLTAVRRAAELANISTNDVDRDLRISAIDLTLHVVAVRDLGAKVEFKVPFIGMPLSFGSKISTQNTHTITIELVPPDPKGRFTVRSGADVDETLLEAIETIRTAISVAAGSDDSFVLRSSQVELTFVVTEEGSISLIGTADMSSEVTHTLRLTLELAGG